MFKGVECGVHVLVHYQYLYSCYTSTCTCTCTWTNDSWLMTHEAGGWLGLFLPVVCWGLCLKRCRWCLWYVNWYKQRYKMIFAVSIVVSKQWAIRIGLSTRISMTISTHKHTNSSWTKGETQFFAQTERRRLTFNIFGFSDSELKNPVVIEPGAKEVMQEFPFGVICASRTSCSKAA
jgi:hypothetical protein